MAQSNLSLEILTNSYLQCLSTEGKSPRTIEFYSGNLKRFMRYLRDHGLTDLVNHIGLMEARSFIGYLQTETCRWENHPNMKKEQRLSPYSVHGYVRSIKAFWGWLHTEGYINNNVMTGLKTPKVPKKIIPTFTTEQIQKMIAVIDRSTPLGFRDFIIVSILLDTGIRLSELAGLQIEDIDFIHSCFVVRGKGNKERIVPFGNQVRQHIRKYLTQFRPEPESSHIGHLLLTSAGLPLKTRSIHSIIFRLGMTAAISGVRCTPHTFRHTFAKQYLMQGGDIFSLQRILGHTSLEVVSMYINLASTDIMQQHHKFSPVDNIYPSMRRRRLGTPKPY